MSKYFTGSPDRNGQISINCLIYQYFSILALALLYCLHRLVDENSDGTASRPSVSQRLNLDLQPRSRGFFLP